MDRDIFKYLTDIRAIGARSGIIAAGIAANSEIFQFRNPDTNVGKIVLLDLKIQAACNGTAFTAGSTLMRVSKASAWTADGTGGTAQTINTSTTQINSRLAPATEFPTMRIASTAALGAGTKTFGEDIASLTGGVNAGAGDKVIDVTAFNAQAAGYAYTFNPGEGFAVRATVPATGTWIASVSMVWGYQP